MVEERTYDYTRLVCGGKPGGPDEPGDLWGSLEARPCPGICGGEEMHLFGDGNRVTIVAILCEGQG